MGNRSLHRLFQYIQLREGTGKTRVQPGLKESGKWGGTRVGTRGVSRKSSQGDHPESHKTVYKVPSHKGEIRGETQACRVEAEDNWAQNPSMSWGDF